MNLSIRVRDSMQGRINQTQKEKDLTITEKMDGEYATLSEVKKVLSTSFDKKRDSEVRHSWVSSLRTKMDGVGASAQTMCCDIGEETTAVSKLGPNKRTPVKRRRVRPQTTLIGYKKKIKTDLEPGTDFISECTSGHAKKITESRFIFKSLQSNPTSSRVMGCAASSEIPFVEVPEKAI